MSDPLDCGGSTPLSFFAWPQPDSLCAFPAFGASPRKESGVEPPQSKGFGADPRSPQSVTVSFFHTIDGKGPDREVKRGP